MVLAACTASEAGPSLPPLAVSTHCPERSMTYLGFEGSGPPPVALWKAIRERFPDAIVVEIGDGKLGVVTAEPHDMNVRRRHEEAAGVVGWKGDVVDFPSVTSDCRLAFHTPPPPPP
jgi:hypothetical protein